MGRRVLTGTQHLEKDLLQGMFYLSTLVNFVLILIIIFLNVCNFAYEAPLSFFRFSRGQGGPDNRTQGGARDTGGEVVKRPSILKQDDLKELDELDHDGDEGWAGTKMLITYSTPRMLKYSLVGQLQI